MKKILGTIVLVSALALMSGVAFAETTIQSPAPTSGEIKMKPTAAPVKYTAKQQACIKDAQAVRIAAIKTASDTLNAATKDALKTKQDALKAAMALKDAKAKVAAIKAANEAFNNDAVVKAAKTPYAAAVKAANDKFQSALKTCVAGSKNSIKGLFNKAGAGLTGSFSKMVKFFTGKK